MTVAAVDSERRETSELEQLVKELEFRSVVTTAMLGTLDLEQILHAILSGITSGDGLGFNRAVLFLDDDAGRSLRVRMAVGPTSPEEARAIWERIDRDRLALEDLLPRYEQYRLDPAEHALTQKLAGFNLRLSGLAALAGIDQQLWIETRAPLVRVLARCMVTRSPFATNATTLVHDLGSEEIEFRDVAIVPLSVTERLIGAILADNYYNAKPVGTEDLRRLHALGNLAALAIDRARLHAKTVRMAEVDGLTGVYNRRHYERELERALESARRTGQPLSIVVFDLDHFKRYNDERGHLFGDELLKQVARLLQENVRASDIVARYGGEEFVLLLADTGLEVAEQVAEKLREVVKRAGLGAAEGVGPGLTLSAGVATARAAESPPQLFVRADRALYEAKARGRDRVVAS